MLEGIGIVGIIVYLGVLLIVLIGMWKAFEKAGQPGWGVIIPIYNLYLLTVIAKKPAWWIILMLIPLVNIIILILMNLEIAKNFGKSTGFGIGLAFLGFIFWPLLGFGDAKYQG